MSLLITFLTGMIGCFAGGLGMFAIFGCQLNIFIQYPSLVCLGPSRIAFWQNLKHFLYGLGADFLIPLAAIHDG